MFVFQADIDLTAPQEASLNEFWRADAERADQQFDRAAEGQKAGRGDLPSASLSFTIDRQPVTSCLTGYRLHANLYVVAQIGLRDMKKLDLEGANGVAGLVVFSHCIGGWEAINVVLVFSTDVEAKYELGTPERVINHALTMLQYRSI